MKILMAIVTFHPVVGGTEQQTQALAAALVRKGHDVHVVTWRPPGSAAHEVLDGVQVFRAIHGAGRHLVFVGSYLLSLAWFLWRRRRQYDVMQVYFAYLDAVAAALLRPWLRAPVVLRLGGGGPMGDLAKLRAMHVHRVVVPLLRRLDRCIVVSRQMHDELLAWGFEASRIVLIPNGVDAKQFAPQAPPSSSCTVLSVARLSPEKGLEVLLEAWQRVTAALPGMRLVLVGEGPQRQALVRQAKALGLDGSVAFAGEVADVRPFLNESRVFVLPSLSEGLPNALLQAMAAGLPCVATRVGGIPELIEDGVNGRLVEAGNPEALAETLRAVLNNPEQAARYGRAARLRIEQRFSFDQMVQRYLECYNDLHGEHVRDRR